MHFLFCHCGIAIRSIKEDSSIFKGGWGFLECGHEGWVAITDTSSCLPVNRYIIREALKSKVFPTEGVSFNYHILLALKMLIFQFSLN